VGVALFNVGLRGGATALTGPRKCRRISALAPFDEHIAVAPGAVVSNVARFAEAQVNAGRFASVGEVLRAGVEAIRLRDDLETERVALLRAAWGHGIKSLNDHGPQLEKFGAMQVPRYRALIADARQRLRQCRLALPPSCDPNPSKKTAFRCASGHSEATSSTLG